MDEQMRVGTSSVRCMFEVGRTAKWSGVPINLSTTHS